MSSSSASDRSGAEELGAEVVVAALALDRLEDEGGDVVLPLGARTFRISAIDGFLGALDVAQRLSVTGKRSFGLSRRGQSNLGKYCVLRGSAVFVSDSV